MNKFQVIVQLMRYSSIRRHKKSVPARTLTKEESGEITFFDGYDSPYVS